MASLTQTATVARKSIRYSIYVIVFLIFARLIWSITSSIFVRIFPPAPPPPTVAFGKLPSLPFPDNKVDPNKLTYKLETPQGGLPKLTTQSKVYYMPKSQSSLFSVQEGTNKAKLLGFTTGGESQTETLYKFRHSSVPKTLEINVVTNVFSLSYDLASDPSPLTALPPSPEIATSSIKSYLAGAGLLPADLSGPTTNEFLKIQGGKLVTALSLSEANLTKINIFRSSYDNLLSLGPNPRQANVWFIVSGSTQSERKIISGEYHYFPVDQTKFSTYPIKTSDQAWTELTQGKAYIAQSPSEGTITIRRVFIANYDPDKPTDFFEPIIVFQGDDFMGYVPAVTSQYYGD